MTLITSSRAVDINFDESVGLMRRIDIVVTKEDLYFVSLKYVEIPDPRSFGSWYSSETFFELRGNYNEPSIMLDAIADFIGKQFDIWPKTLLEIDYH